MALPNPPLNPTTRIPNNPFYAPPADVISSSAGFLIVGGGLNINYQTGVISSSGGGGGGVSTIAAGNSGIGVSSPTGNVVITNNGVTRLTAGSGITLSGNVGNITIDATNLGTVNNINAGAGLTGGGTGPSVSLGLATSGVGPATYTLATVTVDAYGRVTSAANGTGVASLNATLPVTISGGSITPTIGVNPATTAARGVVQLSDSVTDTSSTIAATSFAVNQAYQAATSAIPCSIFTSKGQVLVSSNSSTPTALSAGGTGQALVVNPATPTGFSWAPITNCTGTVTCVNTGTGLSGGPIFTTGTISLTNTLASSGSYTNPSLSVNEQGRITAISNGTPPVTSVSGSSPIQVTTGTAPLVSICSASLTNSGAVQLYNDVDSCSTTLALTAAQGKVLQDQISTLLVAGTIELAGTIDASNGDVLSVTSVGVADNYQVGLPLPAASAITKNTYVIVTTPGTFTPPGGVPTAATRGDWFLVSEVSTGVYSWEFLNVGFDAPYATTSVPGVVCLATDLLAQGGTNTNTALTPAAAASAYIPKSTLTAVGNIITATAACTPAALPVGSNGSILAANSACSTGLEWVSGAFIPCCCITGQGALITGTSANNPVALPVGANGEILYANSTCPSGLCWGTPPITCLDFTNKGQILAGTALNTFTQLPVGSDNQVLIACNAATTGLCWGNAVDTIPSATTLIKGIVCLATGAETITGTDTTKAVTPAAFCAAAQCYVPKSLYSNTGTLAVGVGTSAPTAFSVGANGQILSANSACTSGLEWVNGNFIPCSCITGKGAIIVGTAANTPVSLPVGSTDQVLLVDPACSQGVKWGPAPRATPTLFGTVVGCTAGNTISLGEEALLAGSTCFNNNIGIGYRALRSVTTGFKNVAIGCQALCSTVTGGDNIAIGPDTLRSLTTGFGNVAIGNTTGCSVTSAVNNVYIGNLTACSNNASGNVAIGTAALFSGVGMNRAVALGENAARSAVNGDCSTAVGWAALCNATQAFTNTAIGALAGKNITTGSQNVVIGYNVNAPSETNNAQLAIGFDAAEWWLTGDSTKAIKPGAGIRDCNGSTGTSGQVLTSNGANAVQWASSTKGYVYALASGSSPFNVASGITIPLTGIQALQLGIFFSNIINFTVGKKYLLNVTLTGATSQDTSITRWVNNTGQVGPEIYIASSLGNRPLSTSSSWIYEPVAGSESIQLKVATGNLLVYPAATSVVATEL